MQTGLLLLNQIPPDKFYLKTISGDQAASTNKGVNTNDACDRFMDVLLNTDNGKFRKPPKLMKNETVKYESLDQMHHALTDALMILKNIHSSLEVYRRRENAGCCGDGPKLQQKCDSFFAFPPKTQKYIQPLPTLNQYTPFVPISVPPTFPYQNNSSGLFGTIINPPPITTRLGHKEFNFKANDYRNFPITSLPTFLETSKKKSELISPPTPTSIRNTKNRINEVSINSRCHAATDERLKIKPCVFIPPPPPPPLASKTDLLNTRNVTKAQLLRKSNVNMLQEEKPETGLPAIPFLNELLMRTRKRCQEQVQKGEVIGGMQKVCDKRFGEGSASLSAASSDRTFEDVMKERMKEIREKTSVDSLFDENGDEGWSDT